MFKKIRYHMLETFRGRLALLYIAIELAILLFSALLIYIFLSRQVYQNMDEVLLSHAQAVIEDLEHNNSFYWFAILEAYQRQTGDSLELIAANGTIQYASDKSIIDAGGNAVSHALGQAMNGSPATFISTESLLGKQSLRVLAMPIHRGHHIIATLLVAHKSSEIQAFFKLLYLIAGILGVISIVLSSWAGYMMAKRALRPIKTIQKIARKVAQGDLSQRLPHHAKERELQDLMQDLNSMFESLESSFKSQKRFTADASHELRMPLTILKGEIEVALRHPRSEDEYRSMFKQHLKTVSRMQHIVDDLLTLARSDAGMLELQQKPVDLSLLLQEVGQQHLMLLSERHIHLEMDIQDDLEVMGDSSHLERVFFNLLGNAHKYAPEHSTVWLTAYAEKETVSITVCDEGQIGR
ncbi:MAG: histidine kinase dimerization/phospho-acceptor domain-containing protein, partial [Mariprofundaceae bacterium]|nr:histidine kinase dimerization/phospho-acceptor domain-containing protein [Mariprofundaceae bacterium]